MKSSVILLTGGSGFLGSAIIREFISRHEAGKGVRLRLLGRNNPHCHEPWIEYIQGDIRDYACVLRATEGVDLVIHAASQIDWGALDHDFIYGINVTGTRNIIEACRENGVSRLIYTSTMDVLYEGKPVVFGDDDTPYPALSSDSYAATKREAEQMVLGANGNGFHTCALRPCGIWGEGDPYHLSQIMLKVRARALPFRAGDGSALFQYLYVGNAAHAHCTVADRMLEGDRICDGKAYVITDHPPMNFFALSDIILPRLGLSLPPKERYLPFALMMFLGGAVELTAKVLRPLVRLRPVLTRSSIRYICQDLTFNGERLMRESGYMPKYTFNEAVERTVEWFKENGPVILK